MITHVLQDWVTLTFAAATTIRQSEQEWLELDGFGDCTLWVQSVVNSIGWSFALTLETSPTADDTFFQTVSSTNLTIPDAVKTTIMPFRGRGSSVQLGRFVRWSVTASGTGTPTLTFRMLLSLNPTTPDFRLTRNGETFTNPMLREAGRMAVAGGMP